MRNVITWFVTAAACGTACAGGGLTGGATEFTQILNEIHLTEDYIQQGLQYEKQIQEYVQTLKNMAANPFGIVLPADLQRMASNAARLMKVGKDIASTVARVDQNFADMFNDAKAATFASKFKRWSEGSTDALKTAMLSAGLQREQFADDEKALQELVRTASAADGSVSALNALGSIGVHQVQEAMKLRDLLTQQQVALNTFLAAQTAKDQAKQEATAIQFDSVKKRPASDFSKPFF